MNNLDLTEVDDLVARIIEYTESPESRGYYLKAIRVLGIGLVEEAWGEVKMRVAEGQVHDAAKYLTTILKDWMRSEDAGEERNIKFEQKEFDNQQVIVGQKIIHGLRSFDDLKEVSIEGFNESIEKTLPIPFSLKWLQWVRFVNNDFFALSTMPQKDGWDKVITKMKIDGIQKTVILTRGKRDPDDKAHGILTVEHARILGALEHLWAKQGFRHIEYKKEGQIAFICYCDAPVREVGNLLGYTNIGGANLKLLKQKILDLDSTGYFLEVPDEKDGKNNIGFGFRFLDDATNVTFGNGNNRENIFRIKFSEPYSRQLMARNVVSRPLDLLKIRSEIAFKLYQYIYPMVVQKKIGEEQSIELSNLIIALNLPSAGWHKYKSQRKNIFLKVIKEINGTPFTIGKIIKFDIVPGLSDFVLTARLIEGEVNAKV